MSEPVSVATLLQSALQFGAAIANTVDASKRQAQLVEFQKIISGAIAQNMELQLAHSALLADKEKLEKESVRLRDWSHERVKYQSRAIGPGVFACVENGFTDTLENTHKLCSNCFSQAIKSPLQQSFVAANPGGRMICLTCQNGCPKLVFTHYLNSNG